MGARVIVVEVKKETGSVIEIVLRGSLVQF
jgi:hypothetical protein